MKSKITCVPVQIWTYSQYHIFNSQKYLLVNWYIYMQGSKQGGIHADINKVLAMMKKILRSSVFSISDPNITFPQTSICLQRQS